MKKRLALLAMVGLLGTTMSFGGVKRFDSFSGVQTDTMVNSDTIEKVITIPAFEGLTNSDHDRVWDKMVITLFAPNFTEINSVSGEGGSNDSVFYWVITTLGSIEDTLFHDTSTSKPSYVTLVYDRHDIYSSSNTGQPGAPTHISTILGDSTATIVIDTPGKLRVGLFGDNIKIRFRNVDPVGDGATDSLLSVIHWNVRFIEED